jgi:hypothetical protein
VIGWVTNLIAGWLAPKRPDYDALARLHEALTGQKADEEWRYGMQAWLHSRGLDAVDPLRAKVRSDLEEQMDVVERIERWPRADRTRPPRGPRSIQSVRRHYVTAKRPQVVSERKRALVAKLSGGTASAIA